MALKDGSIQITTRVNADVAQMMLAVAAEQKRSLANLFLVAVDEYVRKHKVEKAVSLEDKAA